MPDPAPGARRLSVRRALRDRRRLQARARRCTGAEAVERRARPGRAGDGRRPGPAAGREPRPGAARAAVARQARRPGAAGADGRGAESSRSDSTRATSRFRLGPRINAAGRLYRADAGVELMLTADAGSGRRRSRPSSSAPTSERREVEREVLAAAERDPRASCPIELGDAAGLVLAGEGWHPGVVGIVASRLVERHHRPAVLIALDADGSGRGSGRSIPGFDLLAALEACDAHLSRYGGHRAAAGLEIEAGRRRRVPARPSPPTARRALADRAAGAARGRRRGGRRREPRPRGRRAAARGWRRSGTATRACALLVPAAKLADVRPMGEGDRHARFMLASGARARARGRLRRQRLARRGRRGRARSTSRSSSSSTSGTGRSSPGSCSARSTRRATDARPPRPSRRRAIGAGRSSGAATSRAARSTSGAWPPAARPVGPGRERVDRRGARRRRRSPRSPPAAPAVLALCADALRRRELVERAVAPGPLRRRRARAGLGPPRRTPRSPRPRPGSPAAGVGRGARRLGGARPRPRARRALRARWSSIDPPPFAHLERARAPRRAAACTASTGAPRREFALRVHADEWPSRSSLAALYRALGRAPARGGVGGAARARCSAASGAPTRSRPRRRPRGPGPGRARARALARSTALNARLGVVSSSGTDLERSAAFVAYRDALRGGSAIPERAKTELATRRGRRRPRSIAAVTSRSAPTTRTAPRRR